MFYNYQDFQHELVFGGWNLLKMLPIEVLYILYSDFYYKSISFAFTNDILEVPNDIYSIPF